MNLDERTLVVVIGDHGEAFGEHGETSHGLFLYNPTTRVPFVMKLPGKRNAGLKISDHVSLADVLPTVCDLMDLDIPQEVQGRSLLPQIEGAEAVYNPIHMETIFPQEFYGWSRISGVLYREWKYFRVPEPELYNIKDDPDEAKNLYGENTEAARRMESLLERLENDLTLDYGNRARVELDTETREKLESLGYIWNQPTSSSRGIDPKHMVHVFAQIKLGMDLIDRQESKEAIEIFKSVLEADPNNPTALEMLGTTLVKLGRYDEAITHWKKVIELNPDAIETRRNLARVLNKMKLYEQAAEQLEIVHRLDPGDTEALVDQGRIFLAQDNSEKAEEYFQRALSLDPNLLQVYLMLGEIYRNRGNYEKALSNFEYAITLDSMNVAIRKNLTRLAQKTGQDSTALYHLKWLALNSKDIESYLNLGITLHKMGKPEEAVASFRKAVALDSLSFQAQNSLGTALMAIKNFSEAETRFKKALSIKNDYALTYYNLAFLYKQTGRLKEAEESHKMYLKLRQEGTGRERKY
jgi:tetratricopeptide (TPR) repeat protein